MLKVTTNPKPACAVTPGKPVTVALSVCNRIIGFYQSVHSTGLCTSLSLPLLLIYLFVPYLACGYKTKFLKMKCLKFKGNRWSIRSCRVQIST